MILGFPELIWKYESEAEKGREILQDILMSNLQLWATGLIFTGELWELVKSMSQCYATQEERTLTSIYGMTEDYSGALTRSLSFGFL